MTQHAVTSTTGRNGENRFGAALDQAKKTTVGKFATAWSELRVGEGAILIAWQLLFSLFPLVVGMLSIFGLVLRDPEVQASIAEAITAQFPDQAGDLVAFISETRELSGIFGIISLIGLLWSGSNLFGTMGRVFDRFYGVENRGFIKQRLVSFLMMAMYAVLVPLSVASTSVTGVLVGLSEEILPFEVPYSAYAIGWAVSVSSAVLIFLALYRVVPNAGLRVWQVWRGAVLAGLLFVALTQMFPLYLGFLGGGFAAYKALGVFLLLMTWFYFLGLILCIGSLLNAIQSGHYPTAAPEPERGAARRRQRSKWGAASTANEQEPESGPIKVVMWAGLTAAVTSLTLLLARRLAATVWQGLTRQEPPVS